MNGIIFELEEKSKYTGRYMDGEISYITLIEWIQGLKPGAVIKIRGIFIYHFL